MTSAANQHLSKLLRLPLDQRARAAQVLLESLDEGPHEAADESADIAEWQRRLASIENGTAVLLDAKAVMKQARTRLRSLRKKT